MTRTSTLIWFLISLSAALAGCAPPPLATSAGSAYFVVRHAEKASDNPRDPSLSPAGQDRAAALAMRLKGEPLRAAYATPYKRTRMTAAPSAEAHQIPVTSYSADEPAAELVARLRRAHPSGSVLLVGHSNTVPDIVAALCACKVAPIEDSDYGNLYEVRFGADGLPVLSATRYP